MRQGTCTEDRRLLVLLLLLCRLSVLLGLVVVVGWVGSVVCTSTNRCICYAFDLFTCMWCSCMCCFWTHVLLLDAHQPTRLHMGRQQVDEADD